MERCQYAFVVRAFVVRRTVDLAGKFNGATILVEEAEKLLPNFYKDIGQLLHVWKPSPPKVAHSDEGMLGEKSKKQETDEVVTGFLPMVIPQPETSE